MLAVLQGPKESKRYRGGKKKEGGTDLRKAVRPGFESGSVVHAGRFLWERGNREKKKAETRHCASGGSRRSYPGKFSRGWR